MVKVGWRGFAQRRQVAGRSRRATPSATAESGASANHLNCQQTVLQH